VKTFRVHALALVLGRFAGEVESEQRCVGTLVAFVARDVRPSISMVLADVRHVAS
jgi:hypothetical protein